jgi:predicted transcriptional regulator
VAEVHQALADSAYTTIATLLSRLEARGLVQHREEGRTYYYRPAVSETGVVQEVVDHVFGGSPLQLVSHLLESEDFTSDELDQLEKLIEDHKRTRKDASRSPQARTRSSKRKGAE